MNKKAAVLLSVLISVLMPYVCMAAQESGGGMSISKIIGILLVIVFLVTTIMMFIIGKKSK